MLFHRTPPLRDPQELSSMAAPRAARDIALLRFEHLDVEYEEALRTCWSYALLGRSGGRATSSLLSDIQELQANLGALHEAQLREGADLIRYFVVGSRIPTVYNLGGDIVFFADRIRAGDREAMRAYAHQCIDVIYANHVSFGLPVISIALVQGDALGGGFENALSHDVIVAERSARLGLPEILFNLFPGMGAYSFLSRRIGAPAAEAMIMSGNLYSASELHAMGIVDVLAEDGQGEAATRDYIERTTRKFNAHHALCRTRRQINPVTLDELRRVVEIWVETAMTVTEPDLRKMERLAMAQSRRLRPAQASHVPLLAAE
ncbi:crotonase/enoyl-CoA hydratase family protein [Lichenicoccus sp.]|uniref:crotonase/enoyl-CoA hydratase family protein n=1 Tax=Lichenicoccus sp. TaxID=2781899 RepID=UPI003D1212CB